MLINLAINKATLPKPPSSEDVLLKIQQAGVGNYGV
jgi:hypothetical protein